MNKFKIPIILIGVLIFGESAGLIYFAYKSQGLARQLSQAQKRLQEIAPNYERLSKEEQDLKSKYTDLLKESEAIKEDRANLLVQTKNLLGEKGRAEELAASLGKANSDIAQLRKEKQDLESQTVALKDEISKLEGSEAKLIKERDEFKLAYEKARKDTTIKELKNEIANLGKVKSNLESNLKNKDKEIEQLQAQRTKLEGTKEQLSGQVKEQKKTIAEAQKKNKALEREVKNIPKKFSEIARQNKMLIRETSEMHYNLGVFYTKNKEYSRAIAEFEKVVEITPDDSYAHFNLGYIYAEYLVNRKKAIEHFRHYLRLAKSDDKDIDWVKKYLLTWETYEGKKPMQ